MAALDEKLALRKSLADGEKPGYTETEQEKKAGEFWKRVLNAVEYRSPEQEYLELLAAKNAEKQQEIVNDLSTQGAMNEKLAERRYWNEFAAEEYAKDNEAAISSGVLYNEHTGEIFIPANKNNDSGGWEAYSMDGKIHVDPKVERKFSVLSNGLASLMTGGAVVTSKPTARMLQPVIANLIEAGILSNHYQEQEYVLSNPRTNEVGVTLNLGFGGNLAGTVSLATDCYGNVAILHSRDLGVSTTPNVSVGMVLSQTNSPLVDFLEGSSRAVGSSVDISGLSVPVGVGADIIGFSNPYTGKGYYGVSVNGGLSLSSIPVEFHAKSTETTIKHMVNLMDLIYPK